MERRFPDAQAKSSNGVRKRLASDLLAETYLQVMQTMT
jgi:hypothetical protein